MLATISRDELKLKIDQRDKFLLVETLPRALPACAPARRDQSTAWSSKRTCGQGSALQSGWHRGLLCQAYLKCFWEYRPWTGGAGLYKRARLCRR